MFSRSIRFTILSAALVITLTSTANAQTSVGPAPLTVFTAMSADEFAINTTAPLPNPANCPLTDLAISSSSTPGYRGLMSAALTAMGSSKKIVFILANSACTDSRPTIIGISIYP